MRHPHEIEKGCWACCLNSTWLLQGRRMFMVCSVLKEMKHDFSWEEIKSWDADHEGLTFWFEYEKPGKKSRQVKIFTKYVSWFTGACVCSFWKGDFKFL